MHLKLKYDPTIQNARNLALVVVKAAKEVDGLDLDFTPGSLQYVDQIVDNFRNGGVSIEQVAETLFSLGCYVGEVLIADDKGKWVATDSTPLKNFSGAPIVVDLNNGNICNPIDKVFKRMQNGPVDSVVHFYNAFSGI